VGVRRPLLAQLAATQRSPALLAALKPPESDIVAIAMVRSPADPCR
jgi:hypothetical protein